ncbi:MAG TPA: flagellar protein FliS [Stellaceae bacterium]|nr:flagellar protein FliS [Stellaceae bacterium]
MDGINGLAAYQRVAGTGAEPEEFMKMALDAARTFLLQADAALVAGDRPKKAKALSSAAKVVEFMLGLSGIESGPLSDCLASVYQYVLAAILKANAWNDREAIAAGRIALDELAAVWRRVFPDAAADATMVDGVLTGRSTNA